MFRITTYMRELVLAERQGQYPVVMRRGAERSAAAGVAVAVAVAVPPGPVVIWNLIRRCNLTCKHCYSLSADHDYAGELATQEVYGVMDDLKAFHVPVLILSGGEPLLRPDIFDIAARARDMAFYVGLSSNGTLIDDAMADRVAAAGFDYVGISLDGIGATHDKFRRLSGAFDRSLAAVRHLHARGVKVGLRYTMTAMNAHDLPALLALMQTENVDKFYFSHLNYAGRGNIHRARDAEFAATREALDMLFEAAWQDAARGGHKEFVTGNNDADGVYFLQWVQQRFAPWAPDVQARLQAWGGNSSGVNVANIDNLGNVHPDTMWWHHTLGNVRERAFSQIWADTSNPLMAGLKARPRVVGGRCAQCQHFAICGGNTRVRAEQVTGDPWAEDPGCYLSDAEIGLSAPSQRVAVTPFAHVPKRVAGAAA